MKAVASVACAILVTASIAGCAMQSTAASSSDETASRTTAISAERAIHAAAIGRSTRGDVRAALGEGTVVHFESGYEVWVYPIADDAAASPGDVRAPVKGEHAPRAEFVILFAPSGRVTRTRLRSEPVPAE